MVRPTEGLDRVIQHVPEIELVAVDVADALQAVCCLQDAQIVWLDEFVELRRSQAARL